MNNVKASVDRFGHKVSVNVTVWPRALLTAFLFILMAGNVMGCSNDSSAQSHDTIEIATVLTAETTATVTETTVVTTAITTVSLYTTTTFVEPDADDMSFDTELGALAFEMSEKDDQLLPLIIGASVEYDYNDYIMFSLDPSLNRSCPDPTNDSNVLENKVLYVHVTDSRFSCWDDIVKYLRNVYSADCERMKGFTGAFARGNAVFDDVETNDMLGEEHLRGFIEYKGRLYRMISGGKSYNTMSTDVFPAIIENRKDTGFTAFVPLLDYGVLDDEVISNMAFSCKEVRLIIDPEYNDWRIDEIIYHDRPVYKDLYEKLNG